MNGLKHLRIFIASILLLSVNQSFAQLKAEFSIQGNKTSFCGKSVIIFDDKSSGEPDSRVWDFGNGQTKVETIAQKQSLVFAPGEYTIKLTVKKGDESNTFSKTVTVHEVPVADFKIDNFDGCIGSNFNFVDASTSKASIAKYQWTSGDGKSSMNKDFSYSYLNEGEYSVTMKITDANGCEDFKSQNVAVSKPLVVNFGATPTETCGSSLSTSFTSNVTNGTAEKYAWNFGNGETATTKDFDLTYNAEGMYTVSLSASTNTGCTTTTTKENYIKVNDFAVNFNLPQKVCAGSEIEIKPTANTEIDPATCSWNFGNSTTSTELNPKVTYSNTGSYTVKFTCQNALGCQVEAEQVIEVIEPVSFDFTADQTQNCGDSDLPVTLSTTAGSSSYLWDFGDGKTSTQSSVTHNFGEGSFDVSLTIIDANGCKNTITKSQFVVNQKTLPSFVIQTNDQGKFCLGSQTSITNTTTRLPEREIVSWEWKCFDESNTEIPLSPDELQNSTITMSVVGNYTVSLTIKDSKGCIETHEDAFSIGEPQVFTIDLPSEACFKDKVSIDLKPTNTTRKFSWDIVYKEKEKETIDDVLGTHTLEHQFMEPGVYDDIRIVVKDGSCPSDKYKASTITIKPPMAKFKFDPPAICEFPAEITFDASESKGVSTYTWNFGDGSPIECVVEPIIKHTFASLPSQEITLKVLNDAVPECDDELFSKINLSGINIGFSQDTIVVCAGVEVNFTDTSIVTYGTISNRTWTFDGEEVSTSETSTAYAFKNDGNTVREVNVKLHLETGENGCTTTNDIEKKKLIKVLPLPKSKITSPSETSNCAPLEITNFVASAIENGAAIKDKYWNFGDGSDNQDSPTSHTYQRGNYNLQYVVIDENNCVSIDSVKIEATFPLPNFAAPAFACIGTEVNFENGSNVSSPAEYEWNFGDETPMDKKISTSHTFNPTNDATVYKVRLTAIDKNKCVDFTEKNIEIRKPIADFEADETLFKCPPANVNFENLSAGTNLIYSWTMGDGSLPTDNNSSTLAWAYGKPGVYSVSLSVTDDKGCSNTKTETDYISVSGPTGEFTIIDENNVARTKACTYDTLTFKALNPVSVEKYMWVFGDTKCVDSPKEIDSVRYSYENGNLYSPALVLTDASGCEVQVFGSNLTVYGIEFGYVGSSVLCDEDEIDFEDTTKASPIAASSTLWEFSNGETFTDLTEFTVPFKYGTYDFKYTTKVDECTFVIDSVEFLRVLRTLDPKVSTEQTEAKILETVSFKNETDTAFGFPIFTKWDFKDGATSENFVTSHSFMESGLFEVLFSTYIHPECPANVVIPIDVLNEYYVPNAFTPNGDGINDIFLNDMGDVDLIIMNRWGQELFKGTGGWDGTCNGKEMSAGTYFYMITLPNGEKFEGPILLIRK